MLETHLKCLASVYLPANIPMGYIRGREVRGADGWTDYLDVLECSAGSGSVFGSFGLVVVVDESKALVSA